jgi:hypothetical protein
MSEAERLGLRAMNDEDKRKIAYVNDKEEMKKEIGYIAHAAEVDTNIIVVITYGHITQGVLEMLYDVGVRRGEKTLLGIEWLAIEVTTDPPEELAAKRRELIYG